MGRNRGRGRGNSTLAPPPPPPPPPIMSADDFLDPAEELKEEDGDIDNGTLPEEDEDMMSDENGDEEGGAKKKSRWRQLRGTRMKRKKVPGAKNRRIKKYAQPKNAVMCLNELEPGTTYVTEQEGDVTKPFCISVEIDGQKYRGYGSSKQLAKQAAAEAALISFVKPPVAASEGQEDKTPWATLVSFAMYKLFSNWREGRVGMCPSTSQPYRAAAIPGGVPAATGATAKENNPQGAAFLETIGAHLDGRIPGVPSGEAKVSDDKSEAKTLPKPAKQVPENAATMHPLMVLNQMRPGVQYTINEGTQDGSTVYVVKTDIDGSEFIGEGGSVKKAKLSLARTAIKELYGVESTFTG